ncbi:MAG: aspartyl/asparaginyl beta-hydroxylase domain-containing protein [Betaproteobacteria bacterium]
MNVLRCARLEVPVDVAALQHDVAALPDWWSPHFQRAHHDGGWTVLPLRSIAGNVDEALPFALGAQPAQYRATALLAQCPAIARFIDSLGCPVMSARLLSLRRGSAIKPHRDADLAFEFGEARLHVPVFTNAGVEFVIDDEPVAMEQGTCWYINANLTHRVANRGDADRIHLVVDCVVDDGLRERFARAECAYSTVRRDPQQTRQMIDLLRAMNTPTSLALIARLEAESSDAT